MPSSICFLMEKKNVKKKKELHDEIEIPSDINCIIENGEIKMKRENKEIKRKLNHLIDVKISGNKIILNSKRSSRKEKKIFGTMRAHIKNMILGLNAPFQYKLQISNVHFPMTVEVDKNKNELRIKNADNVDIKLNKDIIEVESFDIEKAGQVATNIEKGTRVTKKDRRIFQDGIFLIKKPNRSFL